MSAQNKISYRAEAFSLVGSGDHSPFWATSNTYGTVSLEPNNVYGKAGAFYERRFSDNFSLQAGIDVVAATKQYSSVWLQQLYADLDYKILRLTIGSKENYRSMLDKNLSLGDFTHSTNSRPIPGVSLNIPEFTNIPFTKNRLKFKADFFVGKSFDNNYIRDTKSETSPYTVDVLWHHKSLYVLLEDKDWTPFFVLVGLDHAVQWGGWTTFRNEGNLPHSLKDFLRIAMGKQGGSDSLDGEQVNALGNHIGTSNLKIGFRSEKFQAAAYKQHFFDDRSGMEFQNWRDGNWGIEVQFPEFPYLQKAVLEYFQSTNQSGPMHFLEYEQTMGRNPRGGGNDDYYNHEFYFSGWSYYGRGLGNPLITSPGYNKDNSLYFKNNRLKAVHLGMEGIITSEFSYRTLFTGMKSWGRMRIPFLNPKDNFSSLLECVYKPTKYNDWTFSGQLSFDKGDIYGDNFGFAVKVKKEGVLFDK